MSVSTVYTFSDERWDSEPWHPGPLYTADYWYACDQPERPPDEYCVYDFRCHRCLWHAEVAVKNDPDLAVLTEFEGNPPVEWWIARGWTWRWQHEEQPHRGSPFDDLRPGKAQCNYEEEQ